jgi:hypothetical protein
VNAHASRDSERSSKFASVVNRSFIDQTPSKRRAREARSYRFMAERNHQGTVESAKANTFLRSSYFLAQTVRHFRGTCLEPVTHASGCRSLRR